MATEPSLKELRTLPHSIDAERTVLGAILVDNSAFNSAADVLVRDDFYREAHRRIYDAMIALFEKSHPIDFVTVKEELIRASVLDAVGGPAYLASLVDGLPRMFNVGHWSGIVREKSVLRNLIHISNRIAQACYEPDQDASAIVETAEKSIFAIAERQIRRGFVGIRDIVKDSFRTIDQLSQSKDLVTGLATGFVDLDERTTGLQRGDLIIVAARPAMGKTSFCLNIAQQAAHRTGECIGIFSLEMAKEQLVLRMLCADARVDAHRLRTGALQEKDWTRLAKAYAELSAARIFIDDSATLTPLEMRAKCRRLKAEHGLGLVIVDYLQLMNAAGRTENRQQEIASISRSMKGLAKELDVPVIALSQLSRAPETRTEKRPQLSDLRECVTGDTLVVLGDGRRVSIQSLVGTKPHVVAVTPEGRLVTARSDKVWKVGLKPVFKVTLASGRSIRCTERHRLFGPEGWKRLADFRVADRLAIARRLPEPAQAEEWPDARVALLGQLIGDGSYLQQQPMRYTTASEENSALVAGAAREEFGAEVKRYPGRRSWHQILISGNGNRWHPAGVNAWLRELGIFGQRSHEKRVPEAAFRLSNRQVALLLRHLWATDGTIAAKTQSSAHKISYSTNSQRLAHDVSALLLRIGIVTRMYRVRQPGYRPLVHVVVTGADQQRRFLESVQAFGPRRVQAEQLQVALAGCGANTNVDTLPQEYFERVRGLMMERGITTRRMADIRGTTYGGLSHFRFAPSRATLGEYGEILEDGILMEQATSDLFWDRVAAIEVDGEEDVYDLTVPGHASWLADGIVSHNSGGLEQDADVVMFIYREEEYKPSDENRGIAEIIIGKQRNGPTGTIKLAFIREFTRFENLEWRGGSQ